MSKEFQLYQLKNGLRIVYKRIPSSAITHCGFIINAGTRDEASDALGVAHFLEHSLFKGTGKRKTADILNELDDVGGELDAYTTKEQICIYAAFQNDYFEKAVNLLTDITFNSVFPEREIRKEKIVIADEINSYNDSPYDLIFDDFEELIFKDHELGRSILGSPEDIKRIKKSMLVDFIKHNFCRDRIVFSIVGGISVKEVKRITDKYLSTVSLNDGIPEHSAPLMHTPKHKKIRKEVFQAHYCLGGRTYSAKDNGRTAFILLNNLLGGPAMNSRLNLNIREKYGHTYNLESNYHSYSDAGFFSIYLGTDEKYLEKCVQLVYKELDKLRKNKLTSTQMQRAKTQLIGQIALSQESKSSTMLGLGKSLLLHGKINSLEEVLERINKIKAVDLLEAANKTYDFDQLSSITYSSK